MFCFVLFVYIMVILLNGYKIKPPSFVIEIPRRGPLNDCAQKHRPSEERRATTEPAEAHLDGGGSQRIWMHCAESVQRSPLLCGRALTGLTSAQPLPNLRFRSDLVTDFTVLHYNMQYYFLEPSNEEIVEAYVETYSPEATASDVETDADNSD